MRVTSAPQEVPPPPRDYILTLTEKEAILLAELCGNTHTPGNEDGAIQRNTSLLYTTLSRELQRQGAVERSYKLDEKIREFDPGYHRRVYTAGL